MKIIVNADDYGFDENINKAIELAFEKKYISNATIMVNMPGFDEALRISKEKGFVDYIGLHFNIFEGKPMSKKMIDDKVFIDDGCLSSKNILHNLPKYRWLFLPKKTKDAIKEEFVLQSKKFFSSGFVEKHFDSHGHSHAILSVFKSLRNVAKVNFDSTRISRNLFLRNSITANIYKKKINKIIKRNFKTVNFFGSAADFISCLQKNLIPEDCICEIMVHPVIDDNGKLINRNNIDFEELFSYINQNQLISYKDFIESKRV